MEIKKIEYFVAVAKYKSFTKAAQALYVSQPILSRTIREIEAGLSQSLINRTSKHFQLTEKGQLFYEQGLRLLDQHSRLQNLFNEGNENSSKKLIVAGTGVMGISIAQVCGFYGYKVLLYNPNENSLIKAEKRLKNSQESFVEYNEITRVQSEETLSNISFSANRECFIDADYVIECIVEDIHAKQKFFEEISRIVSENTILTSNTNSLSITKISEAVVNPGRFCGMHWANPPYIIPIIEVVQGRNTTEETIEEIYNLILKIKKAPVVVKKDVPGFVMNRLQAAILREALNIVDLGVANYEDVDAVFKFGLGMRYAATGPFESADQGGLDMLYNMSKNIFPELSNISDVPSLLTEFIESERLGVKTGKGFYDYGEDIEKSAFEKRDSRFFMLEKLIYNW